MYGCYNVNKLVWSLVRNPITPHLNGFRREPAISEFDWLFTPSHRSSLHIATGTGSALQEVLPPLQPVHD